MRDKVLEKLTQIAHSPEIFFEENYTPKSSPLPKGRSDVKLYAFSSTQELTSAEGNTPRELLGDSSTGNRNQTYRQNGKTQRVGGPIHEQQMEIHNSTF